MGGGASSDMNHLDANEIEIVGFNGEPLVECGRALPIARRKEEGNHCVLDLSRGPGTIIWHTENEARSFAQARRWTKLVRPVTVPSACVESGAIVAQPMVVFENEALLDVANRVPRPDRYDHEYLMWRNLIGWNISYFAACVSNSAVEAILDDWAEGLLQRFDAMIGMNRDRADLKRIADFALCAARAPILRWKSYLRYAATQEPDRLKQTFERFVSPEYPQVTWEDFTRAVRELRASSEAVLPFPPPPRTNPSHGPCDLRNIATERLPRLVSA